jgi:FG-GAP-like repeat/FG-GAP repeat
MFPPCAVRPVNLSGSSRRRRSVHRRPAYLPQDIWLEDRTLLAASATDVLAATATPIELGTTKTGTLSANDVVFFQINPTMDGRLIAQVHAPGGATRLTLMDNQGSTLLTSDGQSPINPDDLIDVHLSAGTDYLEFQNLGPVVPFTLTTSFAPSAMPFRPLRSGNGPGSIVAGDFNGDGHLDLAVANGGSFDSDGNPIPGTGDVSVLLSNGDGTFKGQVTYAVGTYPSAIVLGDFNGDGHTDLATTDGTSGAVSVLLGNGDGTFRSPITFADENGPYALVAGDFNGDGRTDLAVANQGTNDVSVLLGNGDGTFQNQVTYAVGNSPYALVAVDLNGDGRTDLAVTNEGSFDSSGNPIAGTGNVSVLLGYGDGTFQNQVIYKAGSNPTSLVAGDFNGDGRTDLAVANYGSGDVSVLLGKGDGTFQSEVSYAAGSTPYSIVAGDFNGDGHTDLAVANQWSAGVSVLLGNGDGTFQTAVTSRVGSIPSALVARDFNGDGRTDLAVANNGSNDVSVLLGKGDGVFQTAATSTVTSAVGSHPTSIAIGDFNGDGHADLAIANYGYFEPNGALVPGTGDVSVLLGKGDGVFQSGGTYEVGSNPFALVVTDFNGDGRADLAVANYRSNNVSVLLGNGDGSFKDPLEYAVGSTPYAIVAADFNGDGRDDLAVANQWSRSVTVLLGHGDGSFQNPASYAAGSLPGALAVADFNGDGHLDLAVANEGTYGTDGVFVPGTGDVSVLLGNGDGTFRSQLTSLAGSNPNSLAAGDFNGDGRTDLAVTNYGSEDVSVLSGNGDGTFQDQATYAVGSHPYAIVAGDFNRDGHLDLAVGALGTGSILVLAGQGDGTFQDPVTYAVGSYPYALVVGDFSGDSGIDLAVANEGDGDVSVLLGNGDSTFRNQVTYAVMPALMSAVTSTVMYAAGLQPISLVAGDFNGDGRTDLAIANNGSNDISVLLGNGDGTFRNQVTYAVGSSPYTLVAGDFNGDGRTDLAVANQGSGDISVLLGNGDGTFQAPVPYAVGSNPSAIVVGDFNGDGRTDLAVANVGSFDPDWNPVPGTGYVSVLLGNGDGTFQNQVTYAAGDGPIALVAGDFNGNGRTDLAVANFGTNDVSVLLGNGDGTFQNQVTYTVGSHPVSLVAGDFNGDSRTDLATANQWSGDVSVLLGNGDGTFQSQVTYAVGSDPNALVAGDFTGNGRIDLAVANEGSYDSSDNLIPGTGYVSVLLGNGDGTFQIQVLYALGSNPTSLAATDFNGDSRTDLTVANYGASGVLVLQNGGAGTFVNPGLFATIPHANPTVADLTGDGTDDVFVVNAAGDILYRQGQPGGPGHFLPPVTINPRNPARDIAYLSTPLGPVLTAVDARDDAVSLYAYRAGAFVRVGSIPTGRLPAQIIAGDVIGDGRTDLVVRNAGDGTLTVIPGSVVTRVLSGIGGTLATITVQVGVGVSDVALVDTTGRGVLDLVVTNKLQGEVSVLLNQGGGVFGPPEPYRAGIGLALADSAGTVTSLEATASVAAAFTTGRGTDLLTANPGSDTLGLLAGLGGGRFANPVDIPTAQPAQVVRVADFNHDGISDVAVLGNDTVSIYLGNGQGGFSMPVSYNAGLAPTGLTIANPGHDGNLDLLVGNEYGDVLVLAGQRDGSLRPLLDAGQNVALAVADLTGRGTKDIIYASQNLDRVVVEYGGGQSTLAGASSGVLAPGAVTVADLNGDGIPDLIVANSGGNNVLVYPGLGNGQFGPALNGGKGFFTGTDPVGITVANLNGRPDLVIADRGSNDVTILLNEATSGIVQAAARIPISNDVAIPSNEATAGGGFTFVPGPRLNLKTATQQGLGPVATALVPSPTGGPASLAVSLSGSNQVWVIPGVGGGFFNDQNPTIFNVGANPGPIFFGTFDGRPDLVSVNAGSNDLTLISNFATPDFTIHPIPSGGVDPVTAFAFNSGGAFDSLVVGNNEDGVLALFLGGPDGLSLSSTKTEEEVPSPTSLVFSALTGGQVEFFAATAGRVDAIPLYFDLAAATISVPSPPSTTSGAQLVSLRESSLSLVGTLLIVSIPTEVDESGLAPSDSVASTAAALLTVPATSAGQSVGGQGGGATSQDDDSEPPVNSEDNPAETEKEPADPPSRAGSIWKRYLLGIDDAQEPQTPNDRATPPQATGDGPSALVVPRPARGPVPETATHPGRSDAAKAIDQVLRTLYVIDADRDRATLRAPRVSALPVPEGLGPTDAAGVGPLLPDSARPNGLCLPTTLEPAREERIDVSLSMVVAAVVAGRFFASIRRRDMWNVERCLKTMRRR